MSVSKVASLFALVVISSFSVAACAANTDSPAVEEPAASDEQDLSVGKITACSADADCVAVPQGGCCNNGYLAAVNKHRVKAYEASTKCTAHPRPMCPQFLVHDTRIAACSTAGKCEMVAPKDCRTTGCGGGSTCQICWASYACVPHGAVC